MPVEIRLPKLGQTMEEATIVECCVSLGDKVRRGDILYEIETDKAAMEIESSADGFVKHIFIQPGQTIPVDAPVMILGGKDEQIPQGLIESLRKEIAAVAAEFEAAESETPGSGEVSETLAPQGLVGDIKLGATIPQSRAQKITAEKMLRSKREKPCFYLNVKADVTDLVELRTKLNGSGDVKISYNDFIIRVVALGLRKFPVMSGRLVEDTIELPESLNIALAVAAGQSLVTPVIKKVDEKDIMQIAREREQLVQKARDGKLCLRELEGACITISNLGDFGVDSFIPIVVPGQASILGVGRITDTCLPSDGDVVVRKLMSLTLSVDHKVANGAYAAQFLDFIKKTLEDVKAIYPDASEEGA